MTACTGLRDTFRVYRIPLFRHNLHVRKVCIRYC